MFIYPNQNGNFRISLGIAYLSSYVKQFGHKTDLIDLTFGWDEDYIFKNICKFNPDLIAISAQTTEISYALFIAKFLKVNDVRAPIIFGGVHPTLVPEAVIGNEFVDMIVVGEGEKTLAELANKMEKGEPINNILGLWVKENGNIFRNPVRPLANDLDKYPFPDRELFDKKHFLIKFPGSPVLTMRGCPYSCTFCYNSSYQRIYGTDNYVRYRSVDNVIEEIKLLKKKYDIESVFIVDETFTVNRERALEFCLKYGESIGLPFVIRTNPATLTKDLVFALRGAGCSAMLLGIESGNDKIRTKVMNRPIRREKIIQAFRWARQAKIKTNAYNILGVPGETRGTVFETIELNRECNPDFMRPNLFHPIPQTALWDTCVENNFISERRVKSLFDDSILNLPSIKRKELLALQRTFKLYVKLPKYLWFLAFAAEKMMNYSPEEMLKVYDLFWKKAVYRYAFPWRNIKSKTPILENC